MNNLNLWRVQCKITGRYVADPHNVLVRKTCESFAASSCTDEVASKNCLVNG